MRKSLITITFLMIFMFICIPVFGADVTTSVTASSTTPKQGDVIGVSVKLNNLAGSKNIAISGNISFDESKLEYVGGDNGYTSGSDWIVTLSDDGHGFGVAKQKAVVENDTIFTIKLKVKTSATIGSAPVSISINEASEATDNGNKTISIAGSSVGLTIAESQNQQADQNNAVDPGSNQAADPGTNQATNSGSGTSAGGSSSGDTTKANKAVDKAGLEDVVTIAIFAVSLIGLVSYIKYRSLNF